MDDFSALLSGILSDEGGMAQLRELAQELSAGAPGGLGSLLGMPGGERQPAPEADGPALSALLAAGKALGSRKQDDKNIALLRALEPHLGERRREKAEEAVRVLRILRLLPLLRESGILDGLL